MAATFWKFRVTRRWIVALLAVAVAVSGIGFLTTGILADSASLTWQPFSAIAPGDRHLAEQAMAPMFGDKPALWPDWLEPRALLLPAGDSNNILVVRYPRKAACGAYGYSVLGPVRSGTRASMGQPFCGGGLEVKLARMGGFPDLVIEKPVDPNPNIDVPPGRTRWRWTGHEWRGFPVR